MDPEANSQTSSEIDSISLDRRETGLLQRAIANPRWLVFDAVGTLIEPSPPVAVAYQAVGAAFGAPLNVDEIGKRFRSAFRSSETDAFPGGPTAGSFRSSDDIEFARWRWIVGEVFPEIEQRDQCFQTLWDHFANPSSWRCFDDVGESLRLLSRAGYRLAVASNFDRRLHRVCDVLTAMNIIEKRIVSAEVGFRKPASQFYATLVDACCCPPDQILMIGDSIEHDVRGPQAAGLCAMHLDRRQISTHSSGLASLSDLVDRLIPTCGRSD